MRRKSALAWLGGFASVAAVVAAWLVLGPIGLGGSTGYTLIVGSSMEPKLHKGDLVLVRKASDYGVGDLVAYKSRTIDRVLLHRIIALKGAGYVTKGDSNGFTDPGVATRSDVIGEYWLRIGGAAPVFEWIRQPLHAAAFAGLLGLLLLGGGSGAAVKRRRGRRSDTPKPERASPSLQSWHPVVLVAAVALLASAALGAVAFLVPGTETVPVEQFYRQSGEFSYGGKVPRSVAYPNGLVRSGDAVFTMLVGELPVAFDWRLETAQQSDLDGTAGLVAEVTDGAGWTRRLSLAPRQTFTGTETRVTGVLDLASLRAMLHRFERITGTHAGSYQVRLLPEVRFKGTVDGQPVEGDFMPSLRLTLDQLRLAQTESTDPESPNGLVREQAVPGTALAPNDLSVLGRHFALSRVKLVAAVGAAASLLALLLALLAQRRLGIGDDAARARARYGTRIVGVAEGPPPPYVEVTSIEELALIAERYDRLILDGNGSGAFYVEDDGVSYRWRSAAEGGGTSAADSEQRNLDLRPWVRGPDSPADAAGRAER